MRSGAGRTRFRARLPNRLLRRDPLGAVEFVEDVSVGVERHRRGVSRLPCDLDDRAPLSDQEGYERVSQVIRPDTAEPGTLARGFEDAAAPVPPVVFLPQLGVVSRKEQIAVLDGTF
jgi:hypothetical protein